MARRVHRAKSFSYDLLADWHPYAAPLAPGGRGWVYHGTVTLEGVTGALAWRHGWYGIAVGDHPVRELGLWERIKIGDDLRARAVPGWDTAPTFPEVHPTAVDPACKWLRAAPCMRPKPSGEE